MKKFLSLLLIVVLVFAFAACGNNDSNQGESGGDADKPTPGAEYDAIPDTMESEDGTYELAFVTDVGQLKDGSFNQFTWNGVKAYASENGLSYKYYQPANGDQATDTDRYDAMKSAADAGARIIVAAGFLQQKALEQARQDHGRGQQREPEIDRSLHPAYGRSHGREPARKQEDHAHGDDAGICGQPEGGRPQFPGSGGAAAGAGVPPGRGRCGHRHHLLPAAVRRAGGGGPAPLRDDPLSALPPAAAHPPGAHEGHPPHRRAHRPPVGDVQRLQHRHPGRHQLLRH